MDDDTRSIPVVPYTPAKRYPNMVGDIGGYHGPPLPGTVTQVGAAILAVLVLYVTKGAWAHFGMFRLILFPGLVFGAYFAARAARPEGRTPLECVLGLLAYLCATYRLQGKWFRAGTGLRRSHVETFKGARILLIPADYRKRPRSRFALRWSR